MPNKVTKKYAYVADGSSGLHIIDVTNPSDIKFSDVKTISTSGPAYDVHVFNQYAYVANGSSGLQIINVTDPTKPFVAGSYDASPPDKDGKAVGDARGVQVVGRFAYVADGTSGLQIINVADPTKPLVVGSYDTPGTALGVQVVNGDAYVADDYSGLQIIDVRDPSKPVPKYNYDANLHSTQNVQVVGQYAYVANGLLGLNIIDVIDANNDLIGDAGDNSLTGGLGADILTGRGGSDKFIYSNFNDSLFASADRIRDFNPDQGDRIGLNSLPQFAYNAGTVTATSIRNAIATVFADANVTTAGSQPLGANQAVFFTYGSRLNGGTYLVVNDGLTAFEETKDLFINMTGLTGTVPLGSLTVNNYFTI